MHRDRLDEESMQFSLWKLFLCLSYLMSLTNLKLLDQVGCTILAGKGVTINVIYTLLLLVMAQELNK